MYGTAQSEPHGSGLSHSIFVASIAQFLKPSIYVELGVADGQTFKMVHGIAEKSYAVDISQKTYDFLAADGLADCFHCEDSIVFLSKQPEESISLCFLDSSHEEESTIKEFQALSPKMEKNGVVLFHDSYPPNELHTGAGACGGVWKAIERLKRDANGYFEFATFPSQFGITVARKNFGRQLLWM